MTLEVTRSQPTLMIGGKNQETQIEAPLRRTSRDTYRATFSLNDLSADRSANGKTSVCFSVRSVYQLYRHDTGKIIDNGYENLGGFRLFLQ